MVIPEHFFQILFIKLRHFQHSEETQKGSQKANEQDVWGSADGGKDEKEFENVFDGVANFDEGCLSVVHLNYNVNIID